MCYNWQTCYNQLTAKGLIVCDGMSNPYHCQTFMETDAYHNSCQGQAMYMPVQAIVCKNSNTGEIRVFPTEDLITDCTNLHNQDPAWNLFQCYCCCSCFANGTMIAVPDGNCEVQLLTVGQPILSGSLSGNKVNWTPKAVKFSAGTKDGSQESMIYLVFGDNKELIVSPDHVLMLASGKFTTAIKLMPNDLLMGADGNPVKIITSSLGQYQGGVHHISTDVVFDGTPNNHLINSNGIVSGDYTLQMYFQNLGPQYKVDDHDDRAELGTKQYAEVYPKHAHHDDFMSTAIDPSMLGKMKTSKFSVYSRLNDLPPVSAALWSPAQAEDVLEFGTQYPLSSNMGLDNSNYVLKLLRGFFPDLNFYLDWGNMIPNVYAVREYGTTTVVLNGGLARMKGLSYLGLTMLVGHAVGRFKAGEPENYLGYSCTGYADFYAFAAVGRWVWYQNTYLNNALTAYSEVAALFGLITADNGKGNPNDVCNDPSVACRLSSMQSGFAGGSLPTCAGGKPMPSVGLQLAVGTPTSVTLTLSTGVTKDSAENIANYAFGPNAKVSKATLSSDADYQVIITGVFVPKQTYQVTIANLVSIYGTGVDAAHNSASFTVSALPPTGTKK
jgi:hypothetical protein